MLVLLRQGDGGLVGADADLEACAARVDRQIVLAQPPDQVERRLRGLLARESQRVRRHRRLDCAAHRGGRPEVPIRRRQPLERLVRPLEVVVLHIQRHPSLAVREVREHRARQQLLPQRLPEPLDLAAGLRVVRAALHVRDAVALELRLELRRAAPRRVLPALVGEDLPRCPVRRDPARERLEHQRAPLVVRHREAHQEPRVIVEERRHVHPLVAAQQEREQVRLPQLVRLRPLEARRCRSRPRLEPRCRWRPHLLLAQHPAHRRRRGAEPEEAAHHVADPAAPRLRLLCLHREDRPATWIVLAAAAGRAARHCGLERGAAAVAVPRAPLDRRRVTDAEPLRHLARREVLVHHRPRDRQSHVRRPGLSARAPNTVPRRRPARPLLACHLSSPSLPVRQANPATSARELSHRKNAHQVVRTARMAWRK